MPTETATLPITETLTANSEASVSETLRSANQSKTPVYPIGGGTSLGFGLPAKAEGLGLQLTGMHDVVDYPARDMTITVGAGITIERLQQILAPENQRLPVDAPDSAQATLGGLMATNHSGPLRYGHGTMRDQVIGVRAVDGRGQAFSAGGRVVKNVAGYDFCKLLTGSLGTLGVITEVTLKLKPIPPAAATVLCAPRDLDHAESLLGQIVASSTTPVSIELLCGQTWHDLPYLGASPAGWLAVGFEGTRMEVDWMTDQLAKEWQPQEAQARTLDGEDHRSLQQALIDFPADPSAAFVLKLTSMPHAVTRHVLALLAADDAVGIQVHAGNGIVLAKYPDVPSVSMSKLKSIAAQTQGTATIVSNPSGIEMTHHHVWGAPDVPFDLMKRVKDAFDPNHILNPGRFVY